MGSFGEGFRERLVAARQRSGLTQQQLGTKMVPRASKQQVYRLELDGNPTLATIERLAAELAVDARWLAYGEAPARPWQSEPTETGVYWIRPRQGEGRPYWLHHPQYVYRSGCPGSARYKTSPWYFASSRWHSDGQPLDGRQVCPVDGPPQDTEFTSR